MLGFGDVENLTYLALLQLPKDKIFEPASKLSFSNRVDLVRELIAGRPEIPDDLQKQLSERLSAAKQLSETRNIVAHSPLMMTIYEHPQEGWTHTEMGLGNAKNKDKAISLENLGAAAEEAEAMAKELYELYGKVHKHVVKDA